MSAIAILLLMGLVFNIGFLAGCGWAAAHAERRTLKVVK